MANPQAVALGRQAGAKTVRGRAKRAEAVGERRGPIAAHAGLVRASVLTAAQRRELARQAAIARWSRRPRVATAKDAPEAVRRLLKSYDPGALVWADPDHRYVIAREILVNGQRAAFKWLRGLLLAREIRELVRRHRGAGCSEPQREVLRKKLRLTAADIPVRPI